MAKGTSFSSTSLCIGWITVRKRADLCSTTTISLAQGLADLGHKLTLLSPDQPSAHKNKSWVHYQLRQSKKRGFQASSVGKSAVDWFQNNAYQHLDVVMIDWQVAKYVVPLLNRIGLPTVLIDRSPPADASMLGMLQWKNWKKGWKYVSNGRIASGCVVSEAHQEFIHKQFSIASEKVHVLPAGVDLELFRPKKLTKFDGEIRLVYHGRLDRHRGVLALPILALKLQSKMDCKLTLVGEGDVFDRFLDMKDDFPWLEVHPTLPHKELANLLRDQHIGLLPMPETKVWSLASPLKRSEYLASGLLVYGIEHSGHALEFTEKSWYYLTKQDSFHEAGLTWISGQNEDSIATGQASARKFAVENCSWEVSINRLNNALHLAKIES